MMRNALVGVDANLAIDTSGMPRVASFQSRVSFGNIHDVALSLRACSTEGSVV